jgi:hypothetical protein
MARGVLDDEPHTILHDLESVAYLLMHILGERLQKTALNLEAKRWRQWQFTYPSISSNPEVVQGLRQSFWSIPDAEHEVLLPVSEALACLIKSLLMSEPGRELIGCGGCGLSTDVEPAVSLLDSVEDVVYLFKSTTLFQDALAGLKQEIKQPNGSLSERWDT